VLGLGQLDTFKPTLSPEEQLIWRAGRATGAAPSYFRYGTWKLMIGENANAVDGMFYVHYFLTKIQFVTSCNIVILPFVTLPTADFICTELISRAVSDQKPHRMYLYNKHAICTGQKYIFTVQWEFTLCLPFQALFHHTQGHGFYTDGN
jgi:hypothetical protein